MTYPQQDKQIILYGWNTLFIKGALRNISC